MASAACVLPQLQSASAFHLQSPAGKATGVASIRARGGASAPPSPPATAGADRAAKTALKVAAAGSEGSSEEGKGTGTATIPDEVFNLVKSIVGAGVLSLPAGKLVEARATPQWPLLLYIPILLCAHTYIFALHFCQLMNNRNRSVWQRSVCSDPCNGPRCCYWRHICLHLHVDRSRLLHHWRDVVC